MSDRRSALLEAAIKVIARRGVRGLRVEQVAAEAGVAVSLIYYYFDNRNGLVRATLEHANERAATVAASDGGRGAERPRGGRAQPARRARRRRPCARHVGGVGRGAGLGRVRARPARSAARGERAWSELIAAAIAEGIGDGSIPGDVDAQACAERLTALVDGLSSRWLAGVMTRERALALLAAGIDRELST